MATKKKILHERISATKKVCFAKVTERTTTKKRARPTCAVHTEIHTQPHSTPEPNHTPREQSSVGHTWRLRTTPMSPPQQSTTGNTRTRGKSPSSLRPLFCAVPSFFFVCGCVRHIRALSLRSPPSTPPATAHTRGHLAFALPLLFSPPFKNGRFFGKGGAFRCQQKPRQHRPRGKGREERGGKKQGSECEKRGGEKGQDREPLSLSLSFASSPSHTSFLTLSSCTCTREGNRATIKKYLLQPSSPQKLLPRHLVTLTRATLSPQFFL